MAPLQAIGMILVVSAFGLAGTVTGFPPSAPSWPANSTLNSSNSEHQTRDAPVGNNQKDLAQHGNQNEKRMEKKLREKEANNSNNSRLRDLLIPLAPENGKNLGTPGTSPETSTKEASSQPAINNDPSIEQDNQNRSSPDLKFDNNTTMLDPFISDSPVMSDNDKNLGTPSTSLETSTKEASSQPAINNPSIEQDNQNRSSPDLKFGNNTIMLDPVMSDSPPNNILQYYLLVIPIIVVIILN